MSEIHTFTSNEGREITLQYNPFDDSIRIEGINYHCDFFRMLGTGKDGLKIGQAFFVRDKDSKSGCITISKVQNPFTHSKDVDIIYPPPKDDLKPIA